MNIDHGDIRRQLRELADDYGSSDRLRAEVRARLEAIDGLPDSALVVHEPARRRPGYLLVAAASLAVIGAGVAAMYVLGRGDGDGRVATDDPGVEVPLTTESPAPSAAPPPPSTLVPLPLSSRRYETTLTAPWFAFDLPTGDGVAVSDGEESSDRVAFSVSTSRVTDGQLVVAVPFVEDVDSPIDVTDALQSSLSQAELVDIADVDIGGQPGTRVRLRSDVDMTLVGFRLGPSTFITASGVDRTYEAYVLDRPDGGVVVIWIDASADGIDTMRSIASVVAGSLEW